MTELVAVDIAILPDDFMMDCCFEVNAKLLRQQRGPHVFDRSSCIPHLTLTMGVVRAESIPVLRERLSHTLSLQAKLSLNAILSSRALIPKNGHSVTEYVVELTPELFALHERMQVLIADLLVHEAPLESLLQPPEADTISLEWVKNFHTQSSGKKYIPHITLGLGSLPEDGSNITFKGTHVALCHLGNYCTCRKIFSSVMLTE